MELGWNVNIETSNGLVGMSTNWMGTGLKIFYPYDFKIPDETIMETLEVSMAEPVKNELFGTRLWARYYSERLKDDYGRVWIHHEPSHSYGHTIYTIKEGKLCEEYVGHSSSNTIWTSEFSFCNEKEPDAPNNNSKHIQQYTEKFVNLLVKIAKLMGEIQAVDIDSGLVLYTPETLGCVYKTVKEGWLTKYCYARKDDIDVVLKKGNTMVPWRTILRYPISTEELTDSWIKMKLDSFDNSDDAINLLPLISYMSKVYA